MKAARKRSASSSVTPFHFKKRRKTHEHDEDAVLPAVLADVRWGQMVVVVELALLHTPLVPGEKARKHRVHQDSHGVEGQFLGKGEGGRRTDDAQPRNSVGRAMDIKVEDEEGDQIKGDEEKSRDVDLRRRRRSEWKGGLAIV